MSQPRPELLQLELAEVETLRDALVRLPIAGSADTQD
jgi:hypothetical protein